MIRLPCGPRSSGPRHPRRPTGARRGYANNHNQGDDCHAQCAQTRAAGARRGSCQPAGDGQGRS
jgi:hypothetical protein